MTRRRNPPPRNPSRPLRGPSKDKDQVDSDLRTAKVARKADSQQKQRLRRLEFDEEVIDDTEPERFTYGEGEGKDDDEDEDDDTDRG